MKKIYYPIMIALLLALSFAFYSLTRNTLVYNFRNSVVDICYDYNTSDISDKKIKDAFLVYHTLPSYNDMVLSFKPLKLETYLSKTIISELNRPYQENLKNLK